MAEITIQELAPGKLIYISISGDLQLEEWMVAGNQITEYIRQGSPTMHIVIEALNMGQHPFDVKTILPATEWLKEPTMGWLFVVTTSTVVRMIASMISHTVGVRLRQFDTIEEAIRFAKEVDTSLKEFL